MVKKFERKPNGKTLLFLGGSADCVPALGRAWALGYGVLVVDQDLDCPGRVWVRKMISKEDGKDAEASVASAYDPDQILGAICGRHKIDGVLAVGTDVAPIISRVAKSMELPHIPEQVTRLSWDKPALKKKLREAGIPVVPDLALDDPLLVVKPAVGGRGARGVSILSLEDLPQGLFFQDQLERASSQSQDQSVMIEKFVRGPQISAEALFWNGEDGRELVFAGYTDRDYGGNSWPVEKGGWGPSEKDCPPFGPKLDALVYKVAQTVGLSSGVLKLDIVMDTEYDYRPTVIEAAIGRLGGGYNPSHYLPLVYGVDYLGAAFAVACGENPTQALGVFVPGRHVRYVRGIYQNTNASIHKERGQFFLAVAGSREEAEKKADWKVRQWNQIIEKKRLFKKLDERVKEGLFTTLDFGIFGEKMGLTQQEIKSWSREWADQKEDKWQM